MKKTMIAVALLFTVGITSAFATDKVDDRILSTFKKEFSGVSNVSWKVQSEFVKAAFNLNGTRVEAYFSKEGELLGTARNILFNQLPIAVIKEINSRYGLAPVYDIVEYNVENSSVYVMMVDLPTKSLKIKVTASGDISVQKKIRK